jgi:hypothetical protein
VITGGRRIGLVVRRLVDRLDVGVALVGQVEPKLATGLLGRGLEVGLLDRRRRGPCTAVRGDLVDAAAERLDVRFVGKVGDVLAALALVVVTARERERDPDHDGEREQPGDDVAEHQPAPGSGRLASLGLEPLGSAALPLLLGAGHGSSVAA